VAVFLFLFYRIEKRADDPVVDLKLFTNPIYSNILLLSFITFGGMMGAMFLIPVFAQTYLGLDATHTGFLFIPMALTMFVAAPLGGKLSQILPLRYLVAAGMAISAFGIYLFSGLDAKTTSLDLMLPLVVFAAGLGLGMAPMTAAATNSVPANEVGVSSAVLNLVRNIAGAVGIAFFGTILTSLIESNVLALGQDAIINAPSPQVMQEVTVLIILKAQIMAYGEVFVIAAGIMAVGIFVALFLREPKLSEARAKNASAALAIH